MAREQYYSIIDYYLENADVIRKNCVVDEASAHNTFHNLILMYAGCVSRDAIAAQKVHDEIVSHLHFRYFANIPLMVEGGLFVFAGKRKVVTKKFEVEDVIGSLWTIMLCLKLSYRFTEKFHKEAHEIAAAIRTHTQL